MYILQNAIQIFHDGNTVILNSRNNGMPLVYNANGTEISIDGGRTSFIGTYTDINDINIKDLRLTYDSDMDDFYNKLLWADTQNDELFSYYKWVFVKDLPIQKLKILVEEYQDIHPYIYKAIKYIYNIKKL